MVRPNALAEIGALLGEPSRAAMLDALMDGRALTARELALHAGVTPQTASGHLARLLEAGLLAVTQQGRHRYHRLSSPEVARLLEHLGNFAARPGNQRAVVTGPRDAAMRLARTCYDHLAGRVGVGIADSLLEAGHLELSPDGGQVTPSGHAFFERFGILDNSAGTATGAPLFCRPCLDWSERRTHLAGTVGAAIACRCFTLGWLRRQPGTRALLLTHEGKAGLRSVFGLRLDGPAPLRPAP